MTTHHLPYRTNAELPDAVRHKLPVRAQDLYREAYNEAWLHYFREDADVRLPATQAPESLSHQVAWQAVEAQYESRGNHWVPRKTAQWATVPGTNLDPNRAASPPPQNKGGMDAPEKALQRNARENRAGAAAQGVLGGDE